MIKISQCKFNKKELKDIKVGSKIEMEHTNNKKVALRIAKQHECEFPMYYKKGLIPLEKKLKRMQHG
jgi:hypothetical protein